MRSDLILSFLVAVSREREQRSNYIMIFFLFQRKEKPFNHPFFIFRATSAWMIIMLRKSRFMTCAVIFAPVSLPKSFDRKKETFDNATSAPA